MKKLIDIRFQTSGGNIQTNNRIVLFFSHTAYIYLQHLNFFIEDTDVILITLNSNPSYAENRFYKYGSSFYEGIGSTIITYDLNHFIKLENVNRRLYALSVIHKALKDFANNFNLDIEPLEHAYKESKLSDFFTVSSAKLISETKDCTCWLETLFNFETKIYRLGYEKRSNKTKNLLICEKLIFFGNEHPELSVPEILGIPKTLKVKGWIDPKQFAMQWGEEMYIFDSEREEIKMVL